MKHYLLAKISIVVFFVFVSASQATAEPPALQASGPIIYLADNLDEANNLGWCLDTIGRGLSEVLHTRACSADDASTERDFSFTFNAESGRIASVTFEGKCVAVNAPESEQTIGLFDCEAESASQNFTYNAEQMTLHPSEDQTLCIAASASSMDHGMFQSRAVGIEVCDDVEPTLRQWQIKAAS